jgi:hypothetical protein
MRDTAKSLGHQRMHAPEKSRAGYHSTVQPHLNGRTAARSPYRRQHKPVQSAEGRS